MKLEALKELVAKVEGGSTSWSGVCVKAAFDGHYQSLFYEAFHGSLDAAKALHDAVLPGWDYILGNTCNSLTIHARVGPHEEEFSDNLARAWLLAILRALIAQEEGK
jgi:hypothetical protein